MKKRSFKHSKCAITVFLPLLFGFYSDVSFAQSKLDALQGVAKSDFNAAAALKKLPDPPAPHLRYDPPEIPTPMGSSSTQVGTHAPFTPSLTDNFNDAASRF